MRPALSVVLVAPEGLDALRLPISRLAAQSRREQIELVIVAPSGAGIDVEAPEFEPFLRTRVVELGEVRSAAAGNAAGVQAAGAPVVAFGEDHSYPQPGWAEGLIEAHRGSWAAVGPVVENANPESAISWADFLLSYGPWAAPNPGGEVRYLPGHNSSYKRELLLGFDGDLEQMLEVECVLHWELVRRGHRLYLDPAVRLSHLNFSRLRSWLAATFLAGRALAARRARAEGWSALRRLAYVLAAPLIPLIRGRRAARDLARIRGARPPRARVVPAVITGLLVSAAGESVGYALGPGLAPSRAAAYESHRERHLNAADRAEQWPSRS